MSLILITVFYENLYKKKGMYAMARILEVDKVTKIYTEHGANTVGIENISFSVNVGEFVCIMGASGSGKTTLLNCISTIDDITSGKVLIGNQDISKIGKKEMAKFRRENLGFIFQDYNLIDTLTVYENIALALSINNIKPNEIESKIKKISDKLNILEILTKYPYQISGGQKQRCACARAIINNPSLILADEPTGALDSNSSKRLMELLEYMNQSLNGTIILVTHDSMCASYAERVIFLKDGKICSQIEKKDGKKDIFYNRILDNMSEIERR